MRIALGSLFQESNSFSPVPGSWAHFGPRGVLRGAALIAERTGTQTELGGAIEVATEQGAELVPLLSAMTIASAGPLERVVFESLCGELVTRLREATGIDGLLLALHGGMVAEGYDDASGEVLRACREVLGARPIVATLDLHANVTQRMVTHATALAGYHTYPHIDMHATGRRAMSLLLDTLAGGAHPAVALRRLPMLLPSENGRTTEGPYAAVMDQVEALMRQPGILDASAFCVQPWLDVADVGCSIVVVADGHGELAEREAERLAGEFWARRADFGVALIPTAEAIEQALSSERRPFVLSDSADAPSSGAPGDSPVMIAALLAASPTRPCLVNVIDAPAVAAMIAAGVGQTVRLTLGGTLAPQLYQPLPVTGLVRLISDGEFTHKGPGFHGVVFHRGRTAVLQAGSVFIVAAERPVLQWDAEFYRSLGLEPLDAQIVVVKSPSAFRASYDPFAAEIMIVDAAGVCSPNLRSLPFKRVRRPLYPLDEFEDWRTPASSIPAP
ncbi:MAG: M81 family metallopeptidase [Anaerolineales bacterium]